MVFTPWVLTIPARPEPRGIIMPRTLHAAAFVLILSLFAFFLLPLAQAETITLSFDSISISNCGETWSEGPCSMRIIETTAEDYSGEGYCIMNVTSFPGSIALMPARLEIDLSKITGIEQIQIDIREASGYGRTGAFLYEEGSTTSYAKVWSGDTGDQTLSLSPAGGVPAVLAVSAHEGLVNEVRITGSTLVETSEQDWGTLKSQW